MTLLTLLTLTSIPACSVKMVPLQDLSLDRPHSVQRDHQSNARILIYPLDDLRKNELMRITPTSYIPVANFFWAGSTNYYPDMTSLLRGSEGATMTVVAGELPAALPSLIAQHIRDSGLTPNVLTIRDLNSRTDINDFDYSLQGRLHYITFQTNSSIIPLAFPLGLLGAPTSFSSMELVLELELIDHHSAELVASHTYSWDGKRVSGLYYNTGPAFDMFTEGVSDVMNAIIYDLERDISAASPGQRR